MKPDIFILRECFDLKADGSLVWRHRPTQHFTSPRAAKRWNTRYAGTVAGTSTPDGYRSVRLNRVALREHQVIYALTHGRWPQGEIDHRNGERADNRAGNLREATRSQNRCNSKLTDRNRSGFKGVVVRKGRFVATITFQGRQTYLGAFDDPMAAHAAYTHEAKRLYGDFARST